MILRKVALLALSFTLIQSTGIIPASFAANGGSKAAIYKSEIKPLVAFEKDKEINLSVSDAIVGEVIKALADEVKHNLIFDSSAKQALEDVIPRIEFTNIKVSEAISFILRLKNLNVRKIRNTLFVSSGEIKLVDDSKIKTYKLSNIKPTDAIAKIIQFYEKMPGAEKPQLIAYDTTNTLVSIVRPSEQEYLDMILPIVDMPIPQVMIEIKLVELSKTASEKLGMSYGFGQKQVAAGFNNATDAKTQIVASNGLKLSFEALRNFTANFNAELEAQILNSQAKILSNPRLATQNGLEAVFESTESAPIVQTTQTAAGQTQSIQTLSIGEKVTVTPIIIDTESGSVTLKLQPDISTRGKDVIVNGNPVPETLKRSVQTTMKVKSGESIVIGGLKRRNTTNASSKIPFLGDVPFIGPFFGTNTNADSETELIIMVTPFILDDENSKLKEGTTEQ